MENGQLTWIANFIWGIADDVLRDLYVRGKYRDVILPLTVIRRLDAVLAPTRQAVLDIKAALDKRGIVHQDAALRTAAGQAFYNTSKFTLRDLKARASRQQLETDFRAYLDGFSPNVQEIIDNFEFRNQIPRLAKAAAEPAACIIPPQTIEEQAKAKAAEEAKLKAAFEGGQIADLNTLSVKQLQTLAKQNGISIARTKSDFIHLLDAAEPGVDHSTIAGAALDAKLKEHKIGLLRTKDDLIQLLAQKQASLKQAQQLADQLKKIPPSGGLHDLTVVELQEMAKAKGVSLNMTKQDVIDMLDELEPGVDHKALQGATLIDAKKKHHIGPLKNKQQLVRALEKAAGEELAEKAKKEAVKTAKK